MRLDFSNERVLAVVAHPDDAELLCAGTLARAKADGAAISVAVVCQGDKGQPAHKIGELAAVRKQEMVAASMLLGNELFFCDVPDGEAADTPEQRRLLIEIFRAFGPTLVLAHSTRDYHPDHRASGALAEAASWFASSPGHVTRSSHLPHPPALWQMDTVNMSGFEPGFYINVGPYVELKCKMLACHVSQLARGKDAGFSPLDELMVRQCAARGAQAGVAAAEAFVAHWTWKRHRAW
jgi:LmbE family N-acetylglucosaminyl deacetylase